jgi:hypothetical protein
VLLLALVVSACVSLYDSFAYQQATALKVETLDLMDKGTEPFSQHQSQAADLRLKLLKAYEYEKGRPKNDESTGMWRIMTDSTEAGSPVAFLEFWKRKGAVNPAFVREQKEQVGQNFDRVIRLESLKLKK